MPTVDLITFRRPGDLDDSPAFQRAIDAVAAAGGGMVRVPAGRFRLSTTVFLSSNVHVAGGGMDRTSVLFDSVAPEQMTAEPRMGILRSSAFVAAGRCPDDVYPAGSKELGDYYISAPGPLSGLVAAGSVFIPVASAASLEDIRAGDWVQLLEGQSGWHPAKSELVRVEAVSSGGLRLATPTDNLYDSGPEGLGAFIERYDRPANPPGGARIDLWARTGFRRVEPVENAGLSAMTIANVNEITGYGGRAYLFVRSVGCFAHDVRLTGGWAWHLDSQDVSCRLDMRGDLARASVGAMFNGSNRIRASIRSREGSLVVEEGAQRLVLEQSTFDLTRANIVIGHYCAGITFRNIAVTNSQSFGISIYKSRNVTIGGSIVAAGAAIRYDTPYPLAQAAQPPAVAPYFDGAEITLDHCELRSTRNPGYDLWLEQPIRAVASVLTGEHGEPFMADGRGHGVPLLGSLVRRADGRQFGGARR
jgi:hypothetical protein